MPDDAMRIVQFQPFEMSDQIGEISKVLPKAQSKLGDVIKTATNPHFKNKYADLASVIAAVVPPFNEAGCSVLQPASFDGQMVTVQTIILHESGQWMRSTLSLRPEKSTPQAVGSCITYARRYALMSLAGVAPEDDDGNAASEPKEYAKAEPKPTPKMEDNRSEGQKVCDWFVPRISQALNIDQLDALHDKHAARINALRETEKHWYAKITEAFMKRRNELLEQDTMAEPQFEDDR